MVHEFGTGVGTILLRGLRYAVAYRYTPCIQASRFRPSIGASKGIWQHYYKQFVFVVAFLNTDVEG